MGIAALFTQTVTAETYTGTGRMGPVYATGVPVACFVNDARKLVRNATGEEVVSETTLYAPLDASGTFTVGTRVTVNGRQAFVLSAYRRDSAGPASTHHTQVTLT